MNAHSPAPVERLVGYELVVPPGWVRIDLEGDIDRQVRVLTDRASKGRSPDESARIRAELRTELGTRLRAAADAGVMDVLMPIEESAGAPTPVSVAVAAFEIHGEQSPMDALLDIAAHDSTSQPVDLDGSVALRSTRVRASEAFAQADLSDQERADAASVLRREVRYIVGDPNDDSRWLTFIMSNTLVDEPGPTKVAEAFEELFDELMFTFRWR